MKLRSIKYHEFEDSPYAWEVEKISYGDINLIVGRNATGKTRALNIINGLSDVLAGRRGPMSSGTWSVEFENEKSSFEFEISFLDNAVTHESLKQKVKGQRIKTLLVRGEDGSGKIWGEKRGAFIEFQSPTDQIAIVARQDKIQHSFFSQFVEWGKETFHFMFGRGTEVRELGVLVDGVPDNFDPKDTTKTISVFKRGEKDFGRKFTNEIIKDMKRIYYNIDKISLSEPRGIKIEPAGAGRPVSVHVKENDLECETSHHNMSAGMLRTLQLIIHFNYRIMAMAPSCFLIDDVGEGLDYERSCALIDILSEKSKNSAVQLFMSTNDRFVMNRVPLEYWTILEREGSVVRGRNIRSDKKLFDDFKFTGLNNFDFFATDFLNEK